jgi:bifunctional DNA-binding transcriptional regulator/antitoxin component of YhaV-PrlF toxin-antitoxin module
VLHVGSERKKRATIPRVVSFKAVLGGAEGERPLVELPFDAKERFGKARAPVRGTVNGAEFRTTVAVYGGVYLIGFNKEVRERAGIAIGDEVEVELELDDEPRTVEVPPALAAALDEDDKARAAFEGLSYTHRREYAEWIAEAKRDETRERRLAKAVTMLRDGVRSP